MILALDTSTPTAALCLWDSGSIIWSRSFTTDRSHNSVIFGHIEKALDECGRDLDAIVVGLGPGSYSGVRVGIAVAQGLSLALGVPVVGLSSLEAYGEGDAPRYWVAGDARRNTRFLARIEGGTLAGEPELIPSAGFAARLDEVRADGEPVYTPDPRVVDAELGIVLGHPGPGRLARKAGLQLESDEQDTAAAMEPHYLRPPYITTPK